MNNELSSLKYWKVTIYENLIFWCMYNLGILKP